jgi:putative heme iron utilization protein
MPDAPSPLLPVDDDARDLARGLLRDARFAALAVLDPDTGFPSVTRIGIAQTASGAPLALLSLLSAHTTAILADPRVSILVGEPGTRGDPLTHPRLTLHCVAQVCDPASPDREILRAAYLDRNPKAGLYIDFADFRLVTLTVRSGFLNAGFGRAHRLDPADLSLR